MRISTTSVSAATRDASIARRAAIAGSFSLMDGASATPRAGISQSKGIGGIEALMALQGLEDATERRKRAVRKGKGALDALDGLKASILSGTLDQGMLNRLRAISGELKESTGDHGLDEVLAEIDLRVQVEIAKLSRR